jgi:hypothetical protein
VRLVSWPFSIYTSFEKVVSFVSLTNSAIFVQSFHDVLVAMAF